MDELERAIEGILRAGPSRITLSASRPGAAARRATARPLGGGWQVECLTGTQAFHQNLPAAALPAALAGLLREEFTQLAATAAGREHSLKLTKKGRLLQNSRPVGGAPGAADGPGAVSAAAPAEKTHDRQKSRLIPEGADIPALRELGLFTAEGKVAAHMQRKYRQVSRFAELVDDALPKPPPAALNVVDFGCGKSALTFVLYHLLTAVRGINATVTGLDLKADVVAKCGAAAQRYGYTGLHFQQGDIADYAAGEGAPVDMVVSLHACDTATDLALAKAVGWGAGIILCVPCCQHELAAQLRSEELAILARYGIVKERAAALMTDALRANLLAACGYKTQLLEFVEMDHTPKNLMIRAVKAGMPVAHRRRALEEAQRLCAAFSLQPCLLTLLRDQGALAGL